MVWDLVFEGAGADPVLVTTFCLEIIQGGPGTEPEPETGTAGTVFQEPEPEPSSLLNCTETHKNPLLRGTAGTETGTARTVPSPNRYRTEPGPPWLLLIEFPKIFCVSVGVIVFKSPRK